MPHPPLAPEALPSTAAPPSLGIYLINLDRAPERRQRMEARLRALNLMAERVTATDGSTLAFPTPAFSPRAYRYLHGRRCIPAEVGCYLSHQACAQRLLDSEQRFALILEDDLIFPDDFPQMLTAALAHSETWDILRLSSVNHGPKFGYHPLPAGRHLAIALFREKGAGAYVINRRAAEWIAQGLTPMKLSYDIAFDLEYLCGLRASFVIPVPVSQAAEPVSQIQNNIAAYKYSRWRYLTVLPFRCWIETARLSSRLGRFVFLWVRTRLPRRAASHRTPSPSCRDFPE